MASEDNFLRLDINNYNNELLYRIINKELLLDDLIDLYQEKYIDTETLLYCVEYMIHHGLTGWNKSTSDIELETFNKII